MVDPPELVFAFLMTVLAHTVVLVKLASSGLGAISSGQSCERECAGAGGCAGRGTFTAAVEVQEQRQMVVSFLYHMAVQRNVRNPFESRDAAAIVNYVDVGLQVRTPPCHCTCRADSSFK